MDRGAWWAAVHGVPMSRIQLSDFPFTFHFHALEKETATYSSVLAWRIPGTGEPGGLPSMGSHRVRHNWSDLAAAAATGSQSAGNPLMKFMQVSLPGGIPVAPVVKNLPANAGFVHWAGKIPWRRAWQSTPVFFFFFHTSILDGRIPWTEEPGGLQSMWSQRVQHNWNGFTHTASQDTEQDTGRRRVIWKKYKNIQHT